MTRIKYIPAFLSVILLLAGCSEVEDSYIANSDSSADVSSLEETLPVAVTVDDEVSAIPQAPEDLVMNCLDTIEVYDEIALSDFVTETNVELSDGSKLLDTDDIGVHEVAISYMYEGNEFTNKVQYSVVDTTAPVLLSGAWNLSVLYDTEFELNNYLSYADNYDRTPTLSYTGEVDTGTLGTYTITASIEDDSGNATTWDINVKVIDRFPSYEETTPEKVDYSDFIARYDNENVCFGIDVSKWQGDIDFDAVRDAGCSFVIIRIGSYYDEITMDSYFRQNLENASAAGLDVGVYLYSTDKSVSTARENAKWIIEQLDGFKLDLPVVFDWENFSNFQQYEISIHDLNEVYAAFADELESHGYSAMLYGSKNYLNNFWSEKTKASHPVWLAHYTDKTDYDGVYAIWQASASGRIPGIYGDVDMDIRYLDVPIE